MNDKQALYKEICQNPYDDTLRLVYADILEENGDEIQANYIRESIALQFPPDETSITKVMEYKERFDKTQKVLDEHWETWIIENEIIAHNFDFVEHKIIWSRGMPDTFVCTRDFLFQEDKNIEETFYDHHYTGELKEGIEWIIRGFPITKIEAKIPMNPFHIFHTMIYNTYSYYTRDGDMLYGGKIPQWLMDELYQYRLGNLSKEEKDEADSLTHSYKDGVILDKDPKQLREDMSKALCSYLRKKVYGVETSE